MNRQRKKQLEWKKEGRCQYVVSQQNRKHSIQCVLNILKREENIIEKGGKMYYRKARVSFYLSWKVFWLRIRDKEMMPKGFFIRIGKE